MDKVKVGELIPFSPPRIDDKIVEEVVDTLKSGWITTGPKTKKFEKELAEYCEVSDLLAVNSWTSGAEMLLHWYGIGPGDEVIVPAYTYCATANIVIHCGAKPVMVDVNDDFCINIDQVRNAITNKTKAIIPVDIAGLPIDYQKIHSVICEQSYLFEANNDNQIKLGRVLLLADAAHSFGAKFKNKPIGSQADFTVFSFHAVKNLTTAEGGGIAINLPKKFDSNEVYKELNTMSLHGQNKDALTKSKIGAWEYDVEKAGFKCNLTDILASIGLVELRRYKTDTLPKRKQLFERYSSNLIKYDWAILPISSDYERESAYHLYLLRVKNISIEFRNRLIASLAEKNIVVNVHYKPLPLLSFYKNLGYEMNDYPKSKQFWETEITLPIYYDLTINQVDYIVDSLVESYNEIML